MKESHPIMGLKAAMAWEKHLLRGEESREWTAMVRAGSRVGELAWKDLGELGRRPDRLRILVLAGKGHNGGDALIAARRLMDFCEEVEVDVLFAFGERTLRPLARRAWEDLLRRGDGDVRFESLSRDGGFKGSKAADFLHPSRRYDLCLDGIFGMQFNPPLREPVRGLVEFVNTFGGVCLRAAVDLPSGMGEEGTDLAFRADFTYMTGIAKAPLFLGGASSWCGRLRYVDIGFFDAAEPEPYAQKRILTEGALAPMRKWRDPGAHKNRNGHLFLIGGSRATPGAILMSAQAALRSGVGLVTVFLPSSLSVALAAQAPEAMWTSCPETKEGCLSLDALPLVRERLEKADAIALGPGFGMVKETHILAAEMVQEFTEVPFLLDGEAFQPEVFAAAERRKQKDGNRCACTPHAGEWKRFLTGSGIDPDEESPARVERRTGWVISLKGPPFTRVFDSGIVRFSIGGGPVLGRGGSGDILTGLAGGLLAQTPDDPPGALARAVVWHNLAAERLARRRGSYAVKITELLEDLPSVLRGEPG